MFSVGPRRSVQGLDYVQCVQYRVLSMFSAGPRHSVQGREFVQCKTSTVVQYVDYR